jgi:hypothetical protein
VIADALEDPHRLRNGQCAGSKLGKYSVCEQVAIFLERGIWAYGLAHNRLKCNDLRAQLSAPFRKYLNVFIDPTCGWLRTVAQMRGLAYRSIPFRQAGDAAAYLAGPTDLPPSRRSVSFPDHAPLPTPPPPATHGPFPRAAP